MWEETTPARAERKIKTAPPKNIKGVMGSEDNKKPQGVWRL